MNLEALLAQVAVGSLSPEQALKLIRASAETDIGFAHVDLHRLHRRGFPEVIYCPGKTADQIIAIMKSLAGAAQNSFATRASPDQFAAVHRAFPAAVHHDVARAITLDVAPLPPPQGLVMVMTAGTSDIPVAEEAALTAERLGAQVKRIFDVGVAGLHRLLAHLDEIKKARVIVAVAGMEGALPSVVGGLVDVPIIAVPTSIGYGVHLQGWTPLLAMLNTCSPGISVVNIDNGFGAGVCAALINRQSIS
jgi:NCAIR mutase (PurE)-related protein